MWRSEVGRVLDGDGSPLLHSVPHLPLHVSKKVTMHVSSLKALRRFESGWRVEGCVEEARRDGCSRSRRCNRRTCGIGAVQHAPRVAVGVALRLPER